jgi:hypothetical protein
LVTGSCNPIGLCLRRSVEGSFFIAANTNFSFSYFTRTTDDVSDADERLMKLCLFPLFINAKGAIKIAQNKMILIIE